MIKTTIFMLLLAVFIPFAAIASDVDDVITAITDVKPSDWKVHIDQKNHPPWSRTTELCVKLELYGPALGGHTYFDSMGTKIAERIFLNETINLWITPKGYDSGWNAFTRFLNWFSPWATWFPRQIAEYNGVEVFADESYYPENVNINASSPKGTVNVSFFPPTNGRTWNGWQSDIQQALKKVAPTR